MRRIRLTKIIDFVASCDECQDQAATSGWTDDSNEPSTLEDAAKIIREQGWTVGHGVVLCLRCTAKAKEGPA